MRFENAPLIELVAEFRWLPTNAMGDPVSNPEALGVSDPNTEAFFERLRGLLASMGYNSAERLVPQGFPVPMYQPIFRFRRSGIDEANEIFQVGIGIFSVHAIPPYQDWDHFQPIISIGLKQLISARNETTQFPTAFTRVSLRYINAFQTSLLGSHSPYEFLREVIGLKIALPSSVDGQLTSKDSVEISVNLKAEIDDQLIFSLGAGKNAKFPDALILDLAVHTDQQLLWCEDEPSALLVKSHAAIRKAFLGMTGPIHGLMKMETD